MEPNQKLVNETLESLDGMGRATANPYLYSKVIIRMQSARVAYARPSVIRLAIAVLAIIVGINVFSLMHYEKSSATSVSTNSNSFGQEYFSYLNNVNF